MVGSPEPPRVVVIRELTPEQEREVIALAKRLANLPTAEDPHDPSQGRPSPRSGFVSRTLARLKKGLRK